MNQRDIEQGSIGTASRVGLIALATDLSSEMELRRFLPDDVELFTNRVAYVNPLTLENLRDMAGDIGRAAAGILPGVRLDAIIYGCTSGTIAIGANKIDRLVQESHPGVPTINPVIATLAALDDLGVERISVLTPYSASINDELKRYFRDDGVDVLNVCGMEMDSDIEVAGISANALLEHAEKACDPDADLLFISCTALRTHAVIDLAEQRIGKPVITSNQALAWHVLQLTGYSRSFREVGFLLRQRILS